MLTTNIEDELEALQLVDNAMLADAQLDELQHDEVGRQMEADVLEDGQKDDVGPVGLVVLAHITMIRECDSVCNPVSNDEAVVIRQQLEKALGAGQFNSKK